jgi:hypothetical protein
VTSSPVGLTLGLLLATLGVVWTLGNMGFFDTLGLLHRWWPACFLIWGLVEIGTALIRRPSRTGGGQDQSLGGSL